MAAEFLFLNQPPLTPSNHTVLVTLANRIKGLNVALTETMSLYIEDNRVEESSNNKACNVTREILKLVDVACITMATMRSLLEKEAEAVFAMEKIFDMGKPNIKIPMKSD